MSRSPAVRSRSRDNFQPSDTGQDSLALSAYLRMRREHRFTSPPLGSAQSVQSDRTRPYSYLNQPSREETPQTPLPTINRVDVSLEAISEAMLGVPDISEQLDFTEEEDVIANVDVTGMRLLLQTALRDKELLRRKLLDMELIVENAEKKRQEALEHSQMITSLTDSACKWRLPSLITHILTRYEHHSKGRCLTVWKSKIHALHTTVYQNHRHRLTFQLARRNILHTRLTSIHSFFLRWKSNCIINDVLIVAKGPILNNLAIKRTKKFIFQLFYTISKQKKLLRRIIDNLQATYYRRAIFRWQLYLRYRTQEVVLYSHRLLRLALVNRITTSLHLSTHKSWQIWLKYILHHRLIEQRHINLCVVAKRLLCPEVLPFRKWKVKTFVWYPQQRKVRRFCAILQSSVVMDRLRSSFHRWHSIIQRRSNTCRQILTICQRRETRSLFKAWRTWSSLMISQRESEIKNREMSLKREKIKLTLSLLFVRSMHMTHKAFHTWRQVADNMSHHLQHQSVLFDVDNDLHELRSELALARSATLQVQQQFDHLLQTQQSRSFTHTIKLLVVNLKKQHKQYTLRAFQHWKHQLQLISVTSTFNSHFHSLHKRRVLQSYFFLQEKTLATKCRQTFLTWKLSFQQLKVIRKIIKKWRNNTFSLAFHTWKSRVIKQENNFKKMKRVLRKWLKLKLQCAWQVWKLKNEHTEKIKFLMSKLVKNVNKATLRFAWMQMKNVIHYNQLFSIHSIATQQQADLQSMQLRVFWNKLKIFTSTVKVGKRLLKSTFLTVADHLHERSRSLFLRWKQKTHNLNRFLFGLKIIGKVFLTHRKQRQNKVFSCFKALLVHTQKLENCQLQMALTQLGSRLHSVVNDQLQLENQHSSLTQGNSDLESTLRQQIETAALVMYRKSLRTLQLRIFRTWRFHIVQVQKQNRFIAECQVFTKRKVLNLWKDVFKVVMLQKSRIAQQAQIQSFFNLKNLLLQWRLVNQHFKNAKLVFLTLLKRRHLQAENSNKSRGFYRWCAIITPMVTVKAQRLQPLLAHWQSMVALGKMRKRTVKKLVVAELMGWRRLAMHRWTQFTLQQRQLQHKLSIMIRTLRKLHSYHTFNHLYTAFSAWIALCQEQSLATLKIQKISKVIKRCQNLLLFTAWKQWLSFVTCESKKSRVLKAVFVRVHLIFTSMVKMKFARWKYRALLARQHSINLQHRLLQHSEAKEAELLRKVFASWFQVIKQRGALSLHGLHGDHECFNKEISKHNAALFSCDSIVKALHCVDQALGRLLKNSGYVAQVYFLRSLLDGEEHAQFVGLSSRHQHSSHDVNNSSAIKSKKGAGSVLSAWQSPLPATPVALKAQNDTFEPFSPAGRTTIRTVFDMHTSYHHPRDKADEDEDEQETVLDVYLMGEGLIGQCAESGAILRYTHPYAADDTDGVDERRGLAVLCLPLFHSSNSLEEGRVTTVLQIIREGTITSAFDLLLARDRVASPSKSSSKHAANNTSKLQSGQVLDSLLALRLSIPLTLALLSLSSSLALVVHRLHHGEVQKDIHAEERDQVMLTLQQLRQEHEHLQLQRDLENNHSERLQQQLNERQRSYQQMLALMEKLKASRQKYKELCTQTSQKALTLTNEKDVLLTELEKQKGEVVKLKQAVQKYQEQKQQIASLNKVLKTAAQEFLK